MLGPDLGSTFIKQTKHTHRHTGTARQTDTDRQEIWIKKLLWYCYMIIKIMCLYVLYIVSCYYNAHYDFYRKVYFSAAI